MNATGGPPRPPATILYHRFPPIGAGLSPLSEEAFRQQLLGCDPGASRLWLLAAPYLRHEYADGRISEAEFWRALRQWLRFEERAA